MIAELSAVLGACSPRVTLFSFAEQGAPAELVELAVTMAQQSVESGRYFATALDCKSSLFEMWGYPSWGGCFGTLVSPSAPSVRADICQYSSTAAGRGADAGAVWLSTFSLSEFALRCSKPGRFRGSKA